MSWDTQYDRTFSPFDNPDYKPGPLTQCDLCPEMTREIFKHGGYRLCVSCFLQAIGDEVSKQKNLTKEGK
jgi:hypothetical protein